MEQTTSDSRTISPWLVFFAFWAVFFVVALAWNSASSESFMDLPAHWNIDGIFYDNIALNLSQGRGFIVDFEQPDWRQTYEEANDATGPSEFYKWVLQFEGSGTTTMRSPGYPYFVSVLYRIFGWRFDVVRYAGIVFASLGLAMMMTWCWNKFGYLVGSVAALTTMVDYSLIQTSGMVASEPLAVFAFAMAFVVLAVFVEKPSAGRAILCGVGFACLFLTRGNWNLGLLLVLAMTGLLAVPKIREWLQPIKSRHIAIALAAAICLATPWWIRNCRTVNQFQPFGSAGACGICAAYCDESLADYGNWKSSVFHRNQRAVFKEIDFATTPLAQREYLVGRASMSRATDWALANWYSLPQLAFWRYLSHWGLFNASIPKPLQYVNAVLIIFGLVGCLFLSERQRKLLTFVLLLDAMIVMLTWAHLGRYGIPIRPLLHIGCALTIVRFWQYVLVARHLK